MSGLADRIGMAQTTQVVQTKTLDYFFSLRTLHGVAFQPIVELATGELHEYECLFRPSMPMLPQSISAIVQAAIDTDRSIELDALHRERDHVQGGAHGGRPPGQRAAPAPAGHQPDPGQPARPSVRGRGLRRRWSGRPGSIRAS